MFSKITIFFTLVCFFSLISCDDSGGGSSGLAKLGEVAIADDREITPEDVITEEDVVKEENRDEIYAFNHETGECVSESGIVGRNVDQFVNCGDMNSQTIDKKIFKKKNLYGISLEDTYITNSKIRVKDLVEYEALFNSGSHIDGVNNLMEALFKGHANKYTSMNKGISKEEKRFIKLKKQITNLLKKYKKTNKEQKKAKIERSIASKYAQLEKTKTKLDSLTSKRLRHKDLSMNYGDM